SSFLNWDAEHYHWIRNKGYEGFRVAFFPLFPFIWKLIPIGAIGVSVLNGCVFLVSFYFLIRQLGSSWKEVIVYLSIPGCIFFFLPYSEALFFLCSTLILIGLRKNKMKRSEEHTSELQSRENLVCRLLLEKKKGKNR